MLTHAELKEWLYYNCLTGIFIWLKSFNGRAGGIAGCLNHDGYIHIKINGKSYLAHRLAWFYTYEVWPRNKLDHRDTIRHHNWIDNLREATKKQNNQNVGLKSNNTSGFKGVSRKKGFNTPEEAAAQYQLFAEKIHGEFLHESLKKDILK
ncbi:MAG: HNH endonuclease [Methylococcaceae bacterium]|nr:HNH endonuclease [Methylococcaceae bacterium]